MKRILIFSALCATVLFSNCKKDPTPQEHLIGKWNVTKFITSNENLIRDNDEFKLAVVMECTDSGTLIFRSIFTDRTVSPEEMDEESVTGTYSWDGDNLTLRINDGVEIHSVTGKPDITASHFLFVSASGEAYDFISILEGDKI